ncbi:hypothetical protein BDN70DRAFT_897250 [Pholiota conissans]|uniref:Uncharacterized protein n=1 Tax=Pholiota conissans TaxID=109636 RepID=A0A9P5YXX1_9AGAR|nr:hypothetical protein BDN70DRAFT_897250 [Pholiota conissans]
MARRRATASARDNLIQPAAQYHKCLDPPGQASPPLSQTFSYPDNYTVYSSLANALEDTSFSTRPATVKRARVSGDTASAVDISTNSTASSSTTNITSGWMACNPSGPSASFASAYSPCPPQPEIPSIAAPPTLALHQKIAYHGTMRAHPYLPDEAPGERTMSATPPGPQDTLPTILQHLSWHYKLCFSLVNYGYTEPYLVFHPQGGRCVEDDYDLMRRADVVEAIRRIAEALPAPSSPLPHDMEEPPDAWYIPTMSRLIDETERKVPALACERTTPSNTYRHGPYTEVNRGSKIRDPYERVTNNTFKFRHGRTFAQTVTSSKITRGRPTNTQDNVHIGNVQRRGVDTNADRRNDIQFGVNRGYAHTANWSSKGASSTQDSPTCADTKFSSQKYLPLSSRPFPYPSNLLHATIANRVQPFFVLEHFCRGEDEKRCKRSGKIGRAVEHGRARAEGSQGWIPLVKDEWRIFIDWADKRGRVRRIISAREIDLFLFYPTFRIRRGLFYVEVRY